MAQQKQSANKQMKKKGNGSQSIDQIKLEILLEAAHGSARRIRPILIIMVIASVLVFFAHWNSIPGRWNAKRILIISKVSYNLERLQSDFKDRLFKAIKEKTEPSSPQNSGGGKTLESLKIQNFRKDDALKEKFLFTNFIKQQKLDMLDESKWKEIIKEISFRRFDADEIAGVMKFDIYIGEENVETLRVELEKFDLILIGSYKRILLSGTKELRNYYIKSIENRNQEYLSFNIPYLNIQFDTNDLGFISGMAFFLILGTLYLSLIKEKENTEIAFETSKEVFKKDCVKRRDFLRFMSFNQLLSITSKNHRLMISIAQIIFLYMPVVVLLFILKSDLDTIQIGKMLDPGGSFFWKTMVYRILYALITFILTVLCHKKTKDIDKIWTKENNEITEIEKACYKSPIPSD